MTRKWLYIYIVYYLIASTFYLIPFDWSLVFHPGLAAMSDDELLSLQHKADWRRNHPSHFPPDLAAEEPFSVAVHLVRNRPHLFANNSMSSRATIEAYRRMLFGYEDLLQYLKQHSDNDHDFRKALAVYDKWKAKHDASVLVILLGGYILLGSLFYCISRIRLCDPAADSIKPYIPKGRQFILILCLLLVPIYPTIGVGGSSLMTWSEQFSYYFAPLLWCIPTGFHYHSPMRDSYSIEFRNPVHLLWLAAIYDAVLVGGVSIANRHRLRFGLFFLVFLLLLIVPSILFFSFSPFILILAAFPATGLSIWAASFESKSRRSWIDLWFMVAGFVVLYAQFVLSRFWTFYETGFS